MENTFSIYNLIQRAEEKKIGEALNKFASANNLEVERSGESDDNKVTEEELVDRFKEAQEVLYAQFTGTNLDGERFDAPTLDFKEALTTSDASILFPRVISEILLEPSEPNLWITNNATEIVTMDNAPLFIEFPSLSTLEAFEMSENQEYRSQTLAFQEHMTSIRLRKYGVLASISDEVISNSQWPIIRLHLKHMAAAIARKQESLLYQAMYNRGMDVFDNSSTDSTLWTTGVDTAQANNYSFSYNDLISLVGAIIAKRYEPTHFLAHPMAWPIFATDPLLRAQFFHGGQVATSIWKTAPQFDQSMNFPFGITYIPYYAQPFKENTTLATGPASGMAAVNVTDVTLIDARNALFAITRGDVEMDEMENWLRDSRSLKARKYLGVATKDQGRGIAHAKNIRLVRNHEAIFTVRTVSS